MIVDRRVFIAGAAMAITPAFGLLPPDVAEPEQEVIRPAFMIIGWSMQTDGGRDDQVWIRVGHGWRTVWR
jgi:hypothetical protein